MATKQQTRQVTARISVRPQTLRRIRDFCAGAGMTYDEGVTYLLERVAKSGHEFDTGRALANAQASLRPSDD